MNRLISLFCLLFVFSAALGASENLGEMDAIDSILFNPNLKEDQKVRDVLSAAKIGVTSYEIGSVQLKKTLVLADKNNLIDEKFQILNSIIRFGMFLQEFDTVYYYCNESIAFLKDNDRTELIGEPIGYMMSGYYYQDRYEEAIALFNQNRKHFEVEGFEQNLSNVYYSASINYEQLDEIDSTLFYMEKAISKTDPEFLFDEYLNLTAVLLAMYSEYDRKKQANELILEILEKKENMIDKVNLLSINNSLGQYFQYNANYESAKNYFQEALKISIDKGFATETSITYYHIYEIEKAQGNFENALEILEKYNAIEDSINSVEIKIATQEFEEKYQNDKLTIENLENAAAIKTEETERLKAEAETLKSRKNLYITLFFMLIIIVIAAFWIITVVNNRKKEALHAKLVKEEIERDLAENQLKALRSQMNPHFIFNAINSIQELILLEETEKSYDYLIKFSKLVRNTLEYSKQEFISLDLETAYLNLYLSLEKLRFEENFSYEIKNEIVGDMLVPSIVLQPFVENALKHGLFHKSGDKKLTIKFYEKEHLICEISDNGIGRIKSAEINKRRNQNHNSFSTDAIAKRMQILSEKYDGKVYYEIEDLYNGKEPMGTCVTIHLPNMLE